MLPQIRFKQQPTVVSPSFSQTWKQQFYVNTSPSFCMDSCFRLWFWNTEQKARRESKPYALPTFAAVHSLFVLLQMSYFHDMKWANSQHLSAGVPHCIYILVRSWSTVSPAARPSIPDSSINTFFWNSFRRKSGECFEHWVQFERSLGQLADMQNDINIVSKKYRPGISWHRIKANTSVHILKYQSIYQVEEIPAGLFNQHLINVPELQMVCNMMTTSVNPW